MALRLFEPLAMSVPHEPRWPQQGPCAMLAPWAPWPSLGADEAGIGGLGRAVSLAASFLPISPARTRSGLSERIESFALPPLVLVDQPRRRTPSGKSAGSNAEPHLAS